MLEGARGIDAIPGGDCHEPAHLGPGISIGRRDRRSLLEEGLEASRHHEAQMPAALLMDLIAVRHISRSPDPGAWRRRDHVVPNEDAVLTLKDIERFVLAVMHMERGHGPSRTCHFDSTDYAVGIARRRENRDCLLEETHLSGLPERPIRRCVQPPGA